jgi:ribonuclease HI
MKRNGGKKTRRQEHSGRSGCISIFTDGAGSRPDGKGSAIAWLRADKGEEHFEAIDGLSNNEAEYRSILSALQAVPKGSVVQIRSDSQVAIYQLRGDYDALAPALVKLRELVTESITRRGLTVEFIWIPRAQNQADRVLHRHRSRTESSKSNQ